MCDFSSRSLSQDSSAGFYLLPNISVWTPENTNTDGQEGHQTCEAKGHLGMEINK